MKKIIGNILVILSVLFVITILNLFYKKSNVINAYTLGQENCYPPYYYGPNLVNAMQGPSGGTCPQIGPPNDSHNDYSVWRGYAPLPFSTPNISLNITSEGCTPTTRFGTGYLRIVWTGNEFGSEQYIYLPSAYFENTGCDGRNNDWSCYDYVRFYIFFNVSLNFAADTVYQIASIYDNNGVTITAGPVEIPPQSGGSGGDWSMHYTISLNYLRNQYDLAKNSYININDIGGFKINAINTDYTEDWIYSLTGGHYPANSKHVVIYYDYLTVGASNAFPEYGAPASVSISTAGSGLGIVGAYITWAWPSNPEPTPGIPITGYHVYRSLNSPSGGDPYVSIGIVNSYAVNYITDTSCPGGNVYCYKVLILNNGPDASSPTKNAINATYHESLLAQVTQVCGWVNAKPTLTFTPTMTSTTPPGGWPTNTTPSPTPTATLTPIPSPPSDLAQAHVYPNPYNPNKGSGKFYVDNVVDQTKIYIYAMDGSLVNDGIFNSSQGRFEWNGRNKNDSRVVSGLYYLVLKAPSGDTRVLRIIVCYDCDPVYRP